MASSPRRSELYRSRPGIVMLLALGLLVQSGLAQSSRKQAAPKGPRATGLLQLMPNGEAHLIPIVILIDGKYYDAGSYKASPVPMALESGTVYEAFHTGNSEGLFTVTQVRQLKNDWIADGKWRPAGSEPVAKKTAAAPAKSQSDDDDEGPPKLRHSSAPAPAPEPSPAPESSPKAEAPNATPPPSGDSGTSPAATPPEPEPEDPNRPILHRGASKPSAKSAQNAETQKQGKPKPTPDAKAAEKNPAPAAPMIKPTTVQFIPAVSDAKGPEPHPYTYDMKPDEEQRFRNKMLALAADEVRARDKRLASESAQPAAPARHAPNARTPKLPQPTFEDVQLRVFDLSNSNEPTLVLTATARMPQAAAGSSDHPFFITLVARNDIYNELHKGFSNITDPQHLDVTSRLDLVDAVDVDGDNRGELLFRQTSDIGQGYVIYRVIGDQLYSLYQSSAGQ